MSTTTLEIKNNKILEKYDKEEIQLLFIQFLENLETEKKDKPVELIELDYKDLNFEEKKAYDKVKDYTLEDFIKEGYIY